MLATTELTKLRKHRARRASSFTLTSTPLISAVVERGSAHFRHQKNASKAITPCSALQRMTPTCGPVLTYNEEDDSDSTDDDSNNNNMNNQRFCDNQSNSGSKISIWSKSSASGYSKIQASRNSMNDQQTLELSKAQKRGCFQYIKRRHSIALAFASMSTHTNNQTNHHRHGATDEHDDNIGASSLEAARSNWEYAKTKHGVTLFKSKRSRCEVRGVTQVNASVKSVMSILAAGESTESFAHTQEIIMGGDQVLEARTLASCVPASTSRYFQCGLKYMAIKNPFGVTPLDLVFLDYTDVSTTPDDKLVGFHIIESIRVPECRAVPKYVRASIRCEVYIVRETDMPGVVEVTFASHLDPKSKYSSSKKSNWLDQAAVRLSNLRSYAEKASFSHRLLLEKTKFAKRESRRNCFICETNFSFLRKRHNCRLCGEVSCGRCCRKLPILVDTETTRVRVCLSCMLESRRKPDELGQKDIDRPVRRGSIGNSTWIVYDE